MRLPFEPGPRPLAVDALLGEIPASLFTQTIYACCELAERYATDLALDLVRRLDLEPALRAGGDLDTLAAARGFAPGFRPAFAALLERLAAAGEIAARRGRNGCTIYALEGPLREPELGELRALGLGLDPKVAATLDLFDAAAEAWPAVAAGASTGEQELFSAGRIALWLAYFSNDNPVYGLNNRQAAVVAANRLRPGGGLAVLEVGAGAGSATRALLEELERRGRQGDLARYELTEPSPFFRRRGERELRQRFPGVPFAARALDLDLPFAEQGVVGPFDLVFGVNVLHVARDLGRSLAEIGRALAPGGWLVGGECLRLSPQQPVPADLVFQLFDGFTGVATDPATRPHHGFLEPRWWRAALAAAGLAEAAVVPDLDRIRDLYPRFFAGVVCGRRPAVESH